MTPMTIITPVWNKSDLTHTFLAGHWYFYQARPEVDFVIIDNGSTDGTQMILKAWKYIMLDRLKIISNSDNAGFAAAGNQGAQQAQGDSLVFVNNDVIVQGDYLRQIQLALKQHPGGLVGAAYLDYDTGWNRFKNGTDETFIIPYLAGWCLAMNRETWQALDGFDERYSPADYEDIDFCYRASQSRCELISLNLPLAHLGGQTGFQLKNRTEITRLNRQRFREKWELYEP